MDKGDYMKRLLVVVLMLTMVGGAFAKDKVYVFSAASMTDAVKEIIDVYRKSSDETEFKTSFASSSTLARQIQSGAPADYYISANIKWMDWLEKAGSIETGSKVILAKNSLVLVAAPDLKIAIEDINVLPEILKNGYLAMANYNHVPAGIYGKQALTGLGLFSKVAGRITMYPDVRRTLSSVDMGQAELGIVYKTDAMAAKRARQIYTFPQSSYKPVMYPAAIVKGKARPAVKKFAEFMKSDKVKEIFKKYGFTVE